jgi:hypothetical protein
MVTQQEIYPPLDTDDCESSDQGEPEYVRVQRSRNNNIGDVLGKERQRLLTTADLANAT